MDIQKMAVTGTLVTGSIISLASVSFNRSTDKSALRENINSQTKHSKIEDSLMLLSYTSDLVDEYRVTSDYYRNQRDYMLSLAEDQVHGTRELVELSEKRLETAVKLNIEAQKLLVSNYKLSEKLTQQISDQSKKLDSAIKELKSLNGTLTQENDKLNKQQNKINKLKSSIKTVVLEIDQDFARQIDNLRETKYYLYQQLHGRDAAFRKRMEDSSNNIIRY